MRRKPISDFHLIMEQWDTFYQKSFPILENFCNRKFKYPGAAMKLIEKAFLKLSFEYHNLYDHEFKYIVLRLFEILEEQIDSLPKEENIHNNALILLSHYYNPN